MTFIKDITCPSCKKSTSINTASHILCEHCHVSLLPGVPKKPYKSVVIDNYNKTWGSASDWGDFASGYDKDWDLTDYIKI